MFDRFVTGCERAFRNLSEFMGAPVYSYCRLETADSAKKKGGKLDVLVADDGSLISVLRLEGSLKHVGAEEYDDIVTGLTEKIQAVLTKPGHLVQVVFEFDPESSARRLKELLDPSRISAKNLGMDLSGIFENTQNSLRKYCSLESCWVVLWTRPQVMPETMRKRALKNRGEAAKTVPFIPGTQQVSRGVTELHDAHSGFVMGISEAFKQVNVLTYGLDAHAALHEVRRSVDPEFTSRQWRPLLPGDPLPLRTPEPDSKPREVLQNVVYPALRYQLWPREGEMLSRQAIRIGDRLYTPLIMTLCPQTPKPFQELFRSLARREDRTPWRVSFLIGPDGLNLSVKAIIAGILGFASSQNKRLNSAVDRLKALSLQGTEIVKFQVTFCTWAVIGQDLNVSHQLLKRRAAELAKAIQSWGTCDVSDVVGDPLLGVTASLPAMMPTSPAPVSGAPLDDAIGLLPIFRSASPWREGSLILRTQDGKIIPFQPNSSEQASWVDLGVAPMGAGKSVFLNAFNFAFLTQAGLARLPWISIIDVGPSSSGLIHLTKESLPPHLRHLAAYHRLRMTEDYAINPFDTPLGNRRPLPSHKAFLHNLLCLLATALDKTAPSEGIPGLIQQAIDIAYEDLSDKKHPKKYEPNRMPSLHEKALQLGITMDAETSWWEITDAFFDHGHHHEAIQAQRFAVPILDDLASAVNQNSGIKNAYPAEIINTVWRSFMEASNQYVILKQPTQFDLGDAQIVSLDLDEVAPRGGATADRQAAVMYMLARHVLGSRFFLMPDDVKLMPEKYKNYHAERIEAIREDPKRLCYDEAHRVTKNEAVAGQMVADIQTIIRESRKWNLSVGMYTQSADDFPDIIVELATTILILGTGTDTAIASLVKKFGLNGACAYALSRLGKPGAHGANFIGIFRTGAGMSQLILTLTVGSQSLWAFSTTTEDTTIRNALYKRIGVSAALDVLSKKFPGGSAKPEVERRKRLVADTTDADEADMDVTKQIIDELCKEVSTYDV